MLTEVDRIIFLDYYIFDDVKVIRKACSAERNKSLKVTRLIIGVSAYLSGYSKFEFLLGNCFTIKLVV